MTYRLNGVVFGKSPRQKQYRRKARGGRLDGSDERGTWGLRLDFELVSTDDAAAVSNAFFSGSPVSVTIPHPRDGQFVDVSGVSIVSWTFDPSPIDSGFGVLSVQLANIDFGD